MQVTCRAEALRNISSLSFALNDETNAASHDSPTQRFGDAARYSHEMERYCEKILNVLYDTERAGQVFLRAAETIERVAKGNLNRDHIRTQPFTESLKQECARSQFHTEFLERAPTATV